MRTQWREVLEYIIFLVIALVLFLGIVYLIEH